MIRNERGVALVMVMVLSLISLMIVSTLIYLATESTRTSGMHRLYRTADEAAAGGAELGVEYVNRAGNQADPLFGASPGLGALFSADNACLRQKLLASSWNSVSLWSSCSVAAVAIQPTTAPDMWVTFGSFTAFIKVVDTVEGNTDQSAMVVGGGITTGGVVSANAGTVSPPASPWLYRIEAQAENPANPRERARYSVLYAR